MNRPRRSNRLAAAVLLGIGIALAPAAGVADVPTPAPAVSEVEGLMTHGITSDPASLLQFLRQGFDLAGLPQGLPASPQLKLEVVDAAIRQLGKQRVEAAVPLLMEFVQGRPTPAVDAILRRDFEGIPLEMADAALREAREILASNATVSLGLIGDEQALPVLLERLRSNPSGEARADTAVAIGMLGRADGLEEMVAMARNVESPDCIRAFAAIYVITGRNYGVGAQTSLARRRTIVEQLETWYLAEGIEAPVYRAELMRRRQIPAVPPILAPESLRALLRDTYNAYDYDRRFLARQTVREGLENRTDELRAIADDPMEDLDIRRAAMQWLVAADPAGSRRMLRRLRNDENELIRTVSESLLKEIPDLIAERKRAAE